MSTKSEDTYTSYSCNKLLRSPTYIISVHQRYRQTDRQTDRRHTMAIPADANASCG